MQSHYPANGNAAEKLDYISSLIPMAKLSPSRQAGSQSPLDGDASRQAMPARSEMRPLATERLASAPLYQSQD